MAVILIENLGKALQVDQGKALLRYFHENQVDWMQSCGGKGLCTTCKVIVKEGMQNLSPPSSVEWRYRGAGALADNERLSCQTRVLGDIVILAPAEYKLPHMRYTDDPGNS